MRTFCAALAFALGLTATVASTPAAAQSVMSDHVRTFAVLPDGVRFPEGIAANPANGDIYVATFDFGGPNALLRYDFRGRLLGRLDFGGPLLGLQFGAKDGKLYIANFGASKIQRVKADLTGPLEDVATVPGIGAPAARVTGNPDNSSDTILFGSNSFPAPNGGKPAVASSG